MKLFCILSFLTALTANAARNSSGTLNIDQAVSEAQGKSPEIQSAEAAAEEAGWKRTEALSGFLPSITAGYTHYLKEKYEVLNLNFGGAPLAFQTIYPTSTASLNATLPIFDGFSNVYTLSSASHLKSAAEENYEWAGFKVSQSVRLSFLKALAAQKLQAVSQENLKTITDHLNQTQMLKHGGVATNYDVLRVEVQLNEAKSGVLQSDDNVVLARRQLAIAMGLDGDDRELQGELTVPDSKPIEPISNPETPSRADLSALADQTEAASKRASAAATYLVPRVSLVGQLVEYNDLDSSWSNNASYRAAYNLGITLTWNIFDGMTSISRSREAVYQKVQSEKSLEQARLQIPYDFDFWKRRYLYSAALYVSKKSDVDRSEEAVRLAREGFKAGTRTSSEVLDSELDLFRSRAGAVNAQIDCAEAKINLELALGRTL